MKFRFSFIGFVLALVLIQFLQTQNVRAAAGDLDLNFFNTGVMSNSSLSAFAIQSDGKIIIGGDFTFACGVGRTRLARLNADGSLDTAFNVGSGANGSVNSIAVQTDGRIIIGGDFTTYNGTNRSRIARINSDGSLDTTFVVGTGFNLGVDEVVIQSDGKVLVVGGFGLYNGTAQGRISRLNTDGTLDMTFNTGGAGAGSNISAIALQSDGKIFIGGFFTTYNGTARVRLARLNTDGTLDTTFIPAGTLNSTVFDIAVQTDGKVLVAGSFTIAGGAANNFITRFNTDGSSDGTFTTGTGPSTGLTLVLIQTDGQIIIGGNFTAFNGTTRNRLARLNSNGSLDASFNVGTGPDSPPLALALQTNGRILLGANMTFFNGARRLSPIRLNTDGSLDTSFESGAGLTSSITDMAQQTDGRILVGGGFFSAGRFVRTSLARFNADGTVDETFNATLTSSSNLVVTAIALQTDGRILISGNFTTVNGVTRNRIARLNSDGTLDTSFVPSTGLNQEANHIAVQPDGKILIGGLFTTVNGVSQVRVGRMNTDGTTDNTFTTGTGASSEVEAVALQTDSKIIIGGVFLSYNGTTARRIARLNADGTIDAGFILPTSTGGSDSIKRIVLLADGKFIIVGFLTQYSGTSIGGVARINTDGTLDGTFSAGTGANNEVDAVAIQADNKIVIGGSFSAVNGVTRIRLARLNENGSLDSTFNPGGGAVASVLDAVIQADGRIVIGGDFNAFNNVGRAALARISQGDTITWNGNTSNDWHTASNWNTGTVPTSSDSVIIPAGALPNEPSINSADANSGNLQIASGRTLTVSNGRTLFAVTMSNDGTIAGGGTLNFSGISYTNNGIISVSNVAVITSGFKTLQGTGSLVNNLLTVVHPFSLSLGSNHQISSISTVSTGFNLNGFTLSANGANININTGNNGTVRLNGTALQTVAAGGRIPNLIVDNAAGVTMAGNLSLDRDLTLTNGILNTGAFTLTMSNVGTATRTNGYVIGTISKQLGGPTNFTFHVGTANGYSPLTTNVTSASGGSSINVRAVQGAHPNMNAASSLGRYWEISSVGTITANLTFNYLDIDVAGNENNYRIVRINGGQTVFANQCPASPCVNTATNTAFINGVTQFSDWTMSDVAPTAATASLGGRATFGQNFPLVGATIRLINTNGSISEIRTDENGEFNFNEVPTGETYLVSAERFGFNFHTQNIFVNHLEERDDLLFEASPVRVALAHVKNDFDGDGVTDLFVFRPSSGEWHLYLSLTNSHRVIKWGLADDVITPADYDGDGKTDIAVYRPSERLWYILQSSNNRLRVENFGLSDDVVMPADYDGDGKADIAVYRRSNSVWYVLRSTDRTVFSQQFGLPDDVPLTGYFDNDDKADITVFRQGVWYIFESGSQTMRVVNYGLPQDRAVAADYDGDGFTDVSVFRPSEGVWYSLQTSNNQSRAIQFGLSDDLQTQGDFDGDGKTDIAVYRQGVWFILRSRNGTARIIQFGQNGDKPFAEARTK
jgi:uncharacterized delta-60 repeat protein